MKTLNFFFKRHQTILIATAIFAVNIFIRLPNLSFPNYPVFDEAHFATYAAAYASREAHLDIHPPLGKMIFALPLFFSPNSAYKGTAYVSYDFAGENKKIIPTDYHTFPYTSLRLFGVLFGGLLAAAVFLFTKELTNRLAPAVLASVLITFENAIVLETKLILLNGMFLAFGFLGLYLLLKKRAVWAGVLTGLAISVKLVGGIFGIMGLILATMFKKSEEKTFLPFLLAGGATFLALVLIVENLWIPVAKKELLSEEKLLVPLRANSEVQISAPNAYDKFLISLVPENLVPYVKTIGAQAIFSVGGYTIEGSGPTFAVSHWYAWPLMIGTFPYHFEFGDVSQPALVLLGNPIVWGFGSAGALIGIKRLFERANMRRKTNGPREKDAIEFLTFSYLAYLAIFLLFVHRDAFIYHYFPSLIVSVILFSVLFSEFAAKKSGGVRFWLYASAISLTFLGFVFISPFTYGTTFF